MIFRGEDWWEQDYFYSNYPSMTLPRPEFSKRSIFREKKNPQVPANDRKFQRYGSRDFGRESRYGQRNDWLVDLISFCSFILKYLQDKINFSAVSKQKFSKLVDDTEGTESVPSIRWILKKLGLHHFRGKLSWDILDLSRIRGIDIVPKRPISTQSLGVFQVVLDLMMYD